MTALRLPQTPEKHIALHGQTFVASPSGALYWPKEAMLVVADLHLEKGSAFAARGVFLPPYDSAATLALLGAAIARYAPKRVVALGDSFHDGGGAARLAPRDRDALRVLQAGRDWLWIAGNHDPCAPAGVEGDYGPELSAGSIMFRHEPGRGTSAGEIAGHLHPAVRVLGRSGSLRRRCFVTDGSRMVLPAFGALTGGLDIFDDAFSALFRGGDVRAHVLGRDAVFTVGRRQCLARMPAIR